MSISVTPCDPLRQRFSVGFSGEANSMVFRGYRNCYFWPSVTP